MIFPEAHVKILRVTLFLCYALILLTHSSLFYSRLWWRSTIQSLAVKNLDHKLVILLRSKSQHLDLSLPNPTQNSLVNEHGPEKQPTTPNETTSKSKSIATGGGIISPSDLNLSHIVEETVSTLSQGEVDDIHLHQRTKANSSKWSLIWRRIWQRFRPYSTVSDCEWKQMVHDRENVNEKSWKTPCPDYHSPKHPRSSSIVKKAYCYRGVRWWALLEKYKGFVCV